MALTACYNDVGCDTFILVDRLPDGSEVNFLRKICKDLDGNTTVSDFALDGTTAYSVQGAVQSPSSGGDCSATVSMRKMFDLVAPEDSAILSENDVEPTCAKVFLRHFVYDCEGKISNVYDTESDGVTEYSALNPVEALGEAVPSVIYTEWPSERHQLAPDDYGQYKKFLMPVKNPKTGEVGYVRFESVQPSPPEPLPDNPCNHGGEILALNTPRSDGVAWNQQPSPASRVTFIPDAVVKQMSMLRLEFIDLDTFEGVYGLTPWPDAILEEDGGTENLDLDESRGVIYSRKESNTVYAYYYTIPDQITHLYRNVGGGHACRAAKFTGYSIDQGPFCYPCQKEAGDGNTDGACPAVLEAGAGNLDITTRTLILPPEGYDLVSATVLSTSGDVRVTTVNGTTILTSGSTLSWEAYPGASLTPVKIETTTVAASARVSWVIRPINGTMTTQVLCDSTEQSFRRITITHSNGRRCTRDVAMDGGPFKPIEPVGFC